MEKNTTPAQLRLATYNIRKSRGLDQRRDPRRVIDVINGLDADVIALQEADRRFGQRPEALPRKLIETDTDYELVPLAMSERSLGWHGNALLLRKGLSAQATERIDLPGFEPRGAVKVRIAADVPVTLVATHLGLLRRDRRRQLAVIVEALKDAQNPIVMGDFNEWSANIGLEPLREGFCIHAPGRSFHAARPIAALDRIALSPTATLRDAGVTDSRKARRASDHLPVWADVAWCG